MIRIFRKISLLSIFLMFLSYSVSSIDAAANFKVTVTGNGQTVESTATAGTFYANGQFPISLNWSWDEVGAEVSTATVTIESGGTPVAGLTKSSISTFPTYTASEINGLAAGNYTIKVVGSNNDVGGITNLVIDKTDPTFNSLSLAIENIDDDVLTSTVGNATTVDVTIPALTESNFNNQYRYEYAIGTTGLTYDLIPDSAITLTGSTARITLRANGLNLADGRINFRITALDRAGNETDDPAVGNFTLDTIAPGPVTALTMKDGAQTVAPLATRKAVTQLSWTAPASTTDISYYDIYVKSGVNESFVLMGSGSSTTFNVNTEGYANGVISFKVIAVDNAGNALLLNDTSVLTATFTKFKRDIAIDIQYFASVSSGYLTVSGVSAINSTQRETLKVIDNEPLIASYIISTQDMTNDSYTYTTGNAAALQTALRALTGSPADGYYVVVRDSAANSYKMRLNLQQVGPTLPVTTSLTISSNDTKEEVGINARVTITYTSATNADFYKVYVNGEEVPIVESGVGSVKVDINTIQFGDIENEYELRAYTDEGNFVSYAKRFHITEDLVRPYATINYTYSTDATITYNTSLIDSNNLLTSVNAVLYLNGEEVARQSIAPGTSTNVFRNLSSNRSNYQIKIQGAYRFEGVNSPSSTILNATTVYNIETLRTAPDLQVIINDYTIDQDSISMDITSTKRTTSDFDYEVKVYNSGVLVATTPTSDVIANDTDNLTQEDTAFLRGLSNGVFYQARILDGSTVVGTLNFRTLKDIPTANLETTAIFGQSLSLRLTLTDPDTAITSASKARIKIFEEGTLLQIIDDIATVGVSTRDITNLDYDTEYVFKVYSDHRIANDFNVLNDLLFEGTFRTGKQAPTASITWTEVFDITEDSITFDVNLEDPFVTLIESKVQLFSDGVAVGDPIAINRGRFSNLEFDNLESNTDYVIVIQVKYDLNDGRGVVVKESFLDGFVNTFYRSEEFTTFKQKPTATILSSGVSNKSVSIRLDIEDLDDTFSAGSIKLFDPNITAPVATRVATLQAETFVFDNLDANKNYRVVVEADFDVNDGRGLKTRQQILELTPILEQH